MRALSLLVIAFSLSECLSGRSGRSGRRSSSDSSSSESSEWNRPVGDQLPDGNQYTFDTTACEGYRELWDDPDTPLEDRNQMGRLIFQTKAKAKQAIKLIREYEHFSLEWPMTADFPNFPGRSYQSYMTCVLLGASGGCTHGVNTDAIDNWNTQTDGLTHVFIVDSTGERVFFNNYRSQDLTDEAHKALGEVDLSDVSGFSYLGTENFPPLATRAFLIDVAGYLGVDYVDANTPIGVELFTEVMEDQGFSIYDLEEGDVVIINTGWHLLMDDINLFNTVTHVPGITVDVVTEILDPAGVMLIGSDVWLEWFDLNNFLLPEHETWITCMGGINQEYLNLREWVEAARQGDAPYLVAYFYHWVAFQGAAGSPGAPVVWY